MKKVLLSGLFAFSSLAASAQTITFAMEPTYAPFETTTAKGDLIGFDVDIAKAICSELKATCKFHTQSFDTLIAGLKFKKFDAIISAMDITEARSKQVLFSDPYITSSASFIGIKGKHDIKSAKVIGVQNGTTFQQYLGEKAKRFRLQPYSTLQNASLDLKNGRVDLIFGDTAVLADWKKTNPNFEFIGNKIKDPAFFGQGLGIAVNKSNGALVKQINGALKAIKAKGTYDQIYNKWMK